MAAEFEDICDIWRQIRYLQQGITFSLTVDYIIQRAYKGSGSNRAGILIGGINGKIPKLILFASSIKAMLRLSKRLIDILKVNPSSRANKPKILA